MRTLTSLRTSTMTLCLTPTCMAITRGTNVSGKHNMILLHHDDGSFTGIAHSEIKAKRRQMSKSHRWSSHARKRAVLLDVLSSDLAIDAREQCGLWAPCQPHDSLSQLKILAIQMDRQDLIHLQVMMGRRVMNLSMLRICCVLPRPTQTRREIRKEKEQGQQRG